MTSILREKLIRIKTEQDLINKAQVIKIRKSFI